MRKEIRLMLFWIRPSVLPWFQTGSQDKVLLQDLIVGQGSEDRQLQETLLTIAPDCVCGLVL